MGPSQACPRVELFDLKCYPVLPCSRDVTAEKSRHSRTLMYIRGTRQRRHLHAVPPKRCAESSQMASVAPPARIWDDSPADSCTFRRRRRLRRYAPPPRKDRSAVPGGGLYHGYFAEIAIFFDPNAGTEKWCPHGRLLDKKYFSPKQRCHRVVQVQKCIEIFFVLWVLQCLDGTVSAREDTPLRPTLEPKCSKKTNF